MVAALAADASWVEPYLFAGELSIPGLDDLKGELGDAIKVVLARLTARSGTASASAENNKWQKLIIPVDLPFMHVSTSSGRCHRFISFPSHSWF